MRGGGVCLTGPAPPADGATSNAAESALYRLSLAVGEVQQKYEHCQSHHHYHWHIPVDTEEGHYLVERVEGENVPQVVQQVFVVNSDAAAATHKSK